MSASCDAMNADNAQNALSMKPYEWSPTPSMFTPNQERLVMTLPKIAIGYTLRKHIAPLIDAATTQALVGMTYGVVCFALLFSFVGTVLGGIWADQSWGRFWGWDPKENGALLIVLWNAIILHARWGRYVREKGIMAMAIFGNVITSLSWFGVNMLGVGLHSYGFMDKAFWALAAFIASQLALMALCLAPRQFWRGRAAAPSEERRPEQQPAT